jgi:predicted nuclease of predicted toxin-antitoxin system
VCLIIDANVVHRVLLSTDDADFCDVSARLFGTGKATASLVYGGQLLREYETSPAVMKRLRLLDQAGRARVIPSANVDEETEMVSRLGLCVSNDAHVIALARVADVRLLCSKDQALHRDFTNKKLLDRPRAKVYQSRTHKRLLSKFCG